MNILVTGGAGYIGSITTRALLQAGHSVVVLDNLSTGHRDAVPESATFVQGDIADGELVRATLREGAIDAVVHFAALSIVGESGSNPAAYYGGNVCGTYSLLAAMQDVGVSKLVFSSTAAVYGEPDKVPIHESAAKQPVNVYGRTKLMIETMLQDFDSAYGLRWIALRYFNASGALPDGSMGEDHGTETHLIPLVCKAALKQRDSITIFGEDYQTPDGTCIRDYVHVLDLASAHVLAVQALQDGHASAQYNIGYGHGFSVREVIEAVRKASGVDFPVQKGARRSGDPSQLIADSSAIQHDLGWQPAYDSLDTIAQHAWAWHHAHPEGYAK